MCRKTRPMNFTYPFRSGSVIKLGWALPLQGADQQVQRAALDRCGPLATVPGTARVNRLDCGEASGHATDPAERNDRTAESGGGLCFVGATVARSLSRTRIRHGACRSGARNAFSSAEHEQNR